MGQCVLVIDLFSMELYTCEQDEEHNYKEKNVYFSNMKKTRYDYNLTIMKSPKPATDNRFKK